MDKLQSLRNRLGKPLIVRSAYRSPVHNRAVGGAPTSKHMLGTAFDIPMSNHDPLAFEAAARAVGFLGLGFYPRSGFMHVYLGPARQWGERFPARATAFAAEVVQDVLSETQPRHPSAGAVSRHAAPGVHRRGTWRDCGHDLRSPRRLAPGAKMIAGLVRTALRYGAIALTIILFLLNLRRAGEQAGRLSERLETRERSDAIHRKMLEAASRRPANRDALAERLREGRF